MKKVAFLSMDPHELHGKIHEPLLVEPFSRLGYEVDLFVNYHNYLDVNWSGYVAVVIRTTWDYQQHVDLFVRCLSYIRTNYPQLMLRNEVDAVLWNINKLYLLELGTAAGIPTVPTIFSEMAAAGTTPKSVVQVVRDAFAHFNATQLVIKPTIGASSSFTFRLSIEEFDPSSKDFSEPVNECLETNRGSCLGLLETVFEHRGYMIQPYLPSIENHGEISVFVFGDGCFSHAVKKLPAVGDFRVQEEYGGVNTNCSDLLLDDEPLKDLVNKIQRYLRESKKWDVLYMRVDVMKHEDKYVVGEVELIEPSLYLNMDERSPQRFAEMFHEMFCRWSK